MEVTIKLFYNFLAIFLRRLYEKQPCSKGKLAKAKEKLIITEYNSYILFRY